MRTKGATSWTEQEIEFLKRNYGEKPTKEISIKLDRNLNSIYYMGKRVLGLDATNLKKKYMKGNQFWKLRKPIWTEQMIEFLKKNYSTLGCKECAKRLNKTIDSVRLKAFWLGLKDKRWWSNEQIDFLKKMYGKMPTRKINKKINKSFKAVQSQARKLKLRWYSPKEIEYIKQTYGKIYAKEIAKKIGKSEDGIYGIANKLDLKSRLRHMNLLPNNLNLNPTLGYILGTILGDGCISGNSISLNVKDKDFALTFKKALEEWSKNKVRFYDNHRPGFYSVNMGSIQISSFLNNFIDNKLNEILTAQKEIQAMFLRGLYDSEGTIVVRKSGHVLGFYNKKVEIINLVFSLLKKFGIERIYIKKVVSGFTGRKDCYALNMYGIKELSIFYKNIGFSIQRKQSRLKSIFKNFTWYPKEWFEKAKRLHEEGYSYSKIAKSIGVTRHIIIWWLVNKYYDKILDLNIKNV